MPRGKRNHTLSLNRVALRRFVIIAVNRKHRVNTYPNGHAEVYPTYVRFINDDYQCIGWIEGKSMTALARYWLKTKGKMPPTRTKIVIPVKA